MPVILLVDGLAQVQAGTAGWGQVRATRSGTHFQVPVTWSASYDSRNRLIAFARSGAESRYGYDANGNRLWATEKFAGAVDLDGMLEGENRGQITEQTLNIEATSNRLLGLTQTTTTTQNGKTSSVVTTPVSYGIDANGSTTSDGLRSFEYDAAGRVAKVRIVKNGEAASIRYLYNAAGQRVFKGEPEVEQTLPSEKELGQSFIAWLKNNFGWMFTPRKNGQTTLGQAFVYGSGPLPGWAMLGEYDNGSANGKGTSEYIWLLTGGSAIPVGMLRNGKLYAIQTDHLGTPRLMTDEGNQPVWQWAYSAFGQNEPIGWLMGSAGNGNNSGLKGGKPQEESNLRFPGQYRDSETNINYNHWRYYDAAGGGRYRQSDLIGLVGGWNRFLYAGGSTLHWIDPFGLSPADVQKIIRQFEETVQRMTRAGVRSDNWIINNSLPGHYICADQAGEVLTDLWSKLPKLDDMWKFTLKDNFATKEWWAPGHIWVEGVSSNPSDPIITLDPWKHKHVLQY